MNRLGTWGGAIRTVVRFVAASAGRLLLLCVLLAASDATSRTEKRSRPANLYRVLTASTGGVDNLHLAMGGRSFLWDNDAASRPPFLLPDFNLVYGAYPWLDVAGGMQALGYGVNPGQIHFEIRAALPASSRLRFFNAAQTLSLHRALYDDFPSNGYRAGNEGFGPEGFLLGNDSPFTWYRTTTALGFDFLALWSRLPLRVYMNLGLEWASASNIADLNRAMAPRAAAPVGADAFSKLPVALAVEWNTYSTDFFAEFTAEPFALNLLSYVEGMVTGGSDKGWVRYRIGSKAFDVHLAETPARLSGGARLKYDNGLTLQMGASWLLSEERGARLGPCRKDNPCKDAGATDGFSPFFAQWDVFLGMTYPLRFRQPAGEAYRSYLLKALGERSKSIDIDKELRDGTFVPVDEGEEDEDRLKKILERRKEAGGDDVGLD